MVIPSHNMYRAGGVLLLALPLCLGGGHAQAGGASPTGPAAALPPALNLALPRDAGAGPFLKPARASLHERLVQEAEADGRPKPYGSGYESRGLAGEERGRQAASAGPGSQAQGGGSISQSGPGPGAAMGGAGHGAGDRGRR